MNSQSFGHPLNTDSLRTISLPNDLALQLTTSPFDGVLESFYSSYDRAFVLENEKEEYQGFVDCLLLNSGESHREISRLRGDFNEFIGIVRSSQSDHVLGGLNYLVARGLRSTPDTNSLYASVHLNYIFVSPEARGKQLASLLLNAMQKEVCSFCSVDMAQTPPVFIEVNDPFRLSQDQYELDTTQAGIDQFQRLQFWQRVGAKVIDFDYLQPPLSETQSPDNTLSLAVLTQEKDLKASLLRTHLERFFSISVLKGMSITDSVHAQHALESIPESENDAVRLLDLPPLEHWLDFRNNPQSRERYTSLRQALKEIWS